MGGLLNGEEEVHKAAWERSEAAAYVMRLLTSELVRYLHGLLGNSTLYAPEDLKLFEWSAMKKFSLTASALPLVFAILGDETGQTLHIERPASSLAEVVELEKEENIVGREAYSKAELYLKKARLLRTEKGTRRFQKLKR